MIVITSLLRHAALKQRRALKVTEAAAVAGEAIGVGRWWMPPHSPRQALGHRTGVVLY
jgi:hypothetical protein